MQTDYCFDNSKKVHNCVYAASVIRVLKNLDLNKDYYSMYYWIDLIDPDLLIKKSRERYGKPIASNAQKFSNNASQAYYFTKNYVKCAEISEKSLNMGIDWIDNGENWQKFRLASCLRHMGRFQEALGYLKEVEDYMKGNQAMVEFAEVYCGLDDWKNALEYALELAIRYGHDANKDTCLLLAKIMDLTNPIIAQKHRQLAQNPEDFNMDDFVRYWEGLKFGTYKI